MFFDLTGPIALKGELMSSVAVSGPVNVACVFDLPKQLQIAIDLKINSFDLAGAQHNLRKAFVPSGQPGNAT